MWPSGYLVIWSRSLEYSNCWGRSAADDSVSLQLGISVAIPWKASREFTVARWSLRKRCVASSSLIQVMIEAASGVEQATPEYRARKLESLTRQNKLIEMENKSLEKV